MAEAELVGLQGGRGSFNDSAIRRFLDAHPRLRWRIRYLDTTTAVLRALAAREVSYGQFAIYNTVGGLYEESLSAMGRYRFTVVDTHAMRIAHALMIHRGVTLQQVDTILTHPAVFQQCRRTLAARYPQLEQRCGEGDLADPARVAEHLAAGRLPGSTAVLSNVRLASIHDLQVVEEELQDDPNAESTFVLVAP